MFQKNFKKIYLLCLLLTFSLFNKPYAGEESIENASAVVSNQIQSAQEAFCLVASEELFSQEEAKRNELLQEEMQAIQSINPNSPSALLEVEKLWIQRISEELPSIGRKIIIHDYTQKSFFMGKEVWLYNLSTKKPLALKIHKKTESFMEVCIPSNISISSIVKSVESNNLLVVARTTATNVFGVSQAAPLYYSTIQKTSDNDNIFTLDEKANIVFHFEVRRTIRFI